MTGLLFYTTKLPYDDEWFFQKIAQINFSIVHLTYHPKAEILNKEKLLKFNTEVKYKLFLIYAS